MVQFPYFSRTDGLAALVSVEGQAYSNLRLTYEQRAAKTNNRVKFSYHQSGQAHFSQTNRARPLVTKKAPELLAQSGPLFTVKVQGLESFKSTSERDHQRSPDKNALVTAEFQEDVEAVDFNAHWHRDEDVLRHATEQTVGPVLRIPTAEGEDLRAVAVGPVPGEPPRDHVLLLTCEPRSRLRQDDLAFLLFVGAFDLPDKNGRFAPGSTALSLAYPRGVAEAIAHALPSMDVSEHPS